MSAQFDSIPIVDLGLLNHEQIVQSLNHACETVGFFYVVNHGIPESTVHSVLNASHEFFALPESVKLSIAKNKFNPNNSNKQRGYFPVQGHSSSIKEGIDLGSDLAVDEERNLWPDSANLPNFRRQVKSYFEQVESLGNRLLALISEALGVQRTVLNDLFKGSVSTLRLIRYPKPQIDTEDEQQGLDWADERPVICSSHTDSGLITILYQDATGGLQVQNGDGEWINAPPIPGSFVINLGDVLQFWSGGRFLATQHRVLGSASERMSIPFFFEPSHDASLQALIQGGEKSFMIDGKPVVDLLYKEFLELKIKQFIEFK
eukprot:TRINITY_DN7308_c0_g1_i1.p2 TRINITY_DN7308_c0_g1~~TRINITY_DN7308_c0_g1_i1.p2  ORF type:complete len:318 (-),score=91.75 TRINITY_DN7308_c0_g1_i1:1623-2576(-)